MFLIDKMIEKEKKRNKEMQDIYLKKINELPRGQLSIRVLNKNRKYCYLKYKENGKTITKYVGTIEVEDELRNKLLKRKHFENVLSLLKKEYLRMEKMEKIR